MQHLSHFRFSQILLDIQNWTASITIYSTKISYGGHDRKLITGFCEYLIVFLPSSANLAIWKHPSPQISRNHGKLRKQKREFNWFVLLEVNFYFCFSLNFEPTFEHLARNDFLWDPWRCVCQVGQNQVARPHICGAPVGRLTWTRKTPRNVYTYVYRRASALSIFSTKLKRTKKEQN